MPGKVMVTLCDSASAHNSLSIREYLALNISAVLWLPLNIQQLSSCDFFQLKDVINWTSFEKADDMKSFETTKRLRIPESFQIKYALTLPTLLIYLFSNIEKLEHVGRLARMSVLDTEVDGSNAGSSMLFP